METTLGHIYVIIYLHSHVCVPILSPFQSNIIYMYLYGVSDMMHVFDFCMSLVNKQQVHIHVHILAMVYTVYITYMQVNTSISVTVLDLPVIPNV